LRQTGRRFGGIPQYSFIEGVPDEEKYPAIYNKKIFRRSSFTFTYSDERYTITGIACLPVSKDVQSPEAEVVKGGINQSHVSIRLTPYKEYEYGCHIIITGKELEPHRRHG